MCCFVILLLFNELTHLDNLRWYLFSYFTTLQAFKSSFSPLHGYSWLRENKAHWYPSKRCQKSEITEAGDRRKSK